MVIDKRDARDMRIACAVQEAVLDLFEDRRAKGGRITTRDVSSMDLAKVIREALAGDAEEGPW